MQANARRFSRLYQQALRRYLKDGSKASLKPALKLGRRAVVLGLEALDLALIHEQMLIIHVLPFGVSATRDIIERARTFFAESIIPIEETHQAATDAVESLRLLNQSLVRRTRDLATSNRQLKSEITRRRIIEENLRLSEHNSLLLLEQAQRHQKQMQLLSRRILSAQEDERKRISRELHDVIAQMLTGINVRLATLQLEATSNIKGIGKKISQTQRLVEKSVDIVHKFARELRPAVLDDLGLIPALAALLKNYAKETGIQVRLAAFPGVEQMEIARRTVFYRVAHEALTNVSHHAKATRVDVNIRKLPGIAEMVIRDNGRGFDAQRALRAGKSQRLGLLGIKERVEMIGGIFAVHSTLKKGTTIQVQVPFRITTKEKNRP